MESDLIILNCRKTSQSLFIDSLNCWTILHFSLKILSVYLRKHCSFNLVDSVSIGGHRIIYYGNGFFIYFICLIQKGVGLRKEDNFSFGIHFKCLNLSLPATSSEKVESFVVGRRYRISRSLMKKSLKHWPCYD